MSQAIQELMSNSMDAGATSVEIKLDLPRYRLSISDNGRGIPAEKLQSLVATAQASSKASSTREIQQASTYGFRGEALYSLGLTSLLEIQSRCPGKESYAKVVREGQTQFFGLTRLPMRAGTIVTLRDAFFKWPVRRKAANEAAEMTRIKEYVSRMALMNNNVSITVLDSAKSKIVLKAAATGCVTKTFAQIFASDKLSLCSKLTFNFKQFRLTGYISPPSSSACHWSKEFQFVYVNCKSVRRLEFLQKVINSAFAPCLALLRGRGGADGHGIRRVRNPNASSGQKQELFPVFVLNLECPRKEVDVMVEPEKTSVEFSDWAAAKNACVALLLAFLPHFPHAVPSSVLRDLRRAFHKNEGDDAWRMASSPPTARRKDREPTPSPLFPMRLGMPDVGTYFGVRVGSPPDSCARMGRDRDSGTISKEGRETFAKTLQELQREGFRAEGLLCRPPASHVGACDSDPSRTAGLPFVARDAGCPLTGLHPNHFSPYFTQLDQQHRVSRRDSRQPRRLALDEGVICEDRAGPYQPDSEAVYLHMLACDDPTVAGDDCVGREDGLLTEKVQESYGYIEGGGWATETLGARSHIADQLPPGRPPSLEDEHGPQLAIGRDWLCRLPTVVQEIIPGEELNQGEFSVAGGSVTPNLSSLFAYAFPDADQYQGRLPELRKRDDEMSHVEGDGRGDGGDRRAVLAYDQDVLGGEGAAEAGVGEFETQTVAGVLGKLSHRVSSAGDAAVHAHHGAGGSTVPKAESAAGERPARRGRERPIPQVLQAGDDEIGGGAGAVAVTVTREELGQAFLIGQAGRKFIILRARTGAILCVDQHAADERIKLEELERQVFGEDGDRRNVGVLHLDPAESISITQSDAALLQLHREVLSSWKFEFEVEQAQGISARAPTATLVSVPVVCGVRLSVQDFMGFLNYLREGMEPGSLAGKPPQIQHILNYKACHGAIRFGDLLSRSESLELVRQLAACAHPFVCAHGRPSVVPLCVVGGTLPSHRP
eukprot:g17698.t2